MAGRYALLSRDLYSNQIKAPTEDEKGEGNSITKQLERRSFMDGFSGYNQIRLAQEDQHKTAFRVEWGTFCYKVMPFGFKNAGATYQRAMVTIFHDLMHDCMEDYVDDIFVKSRTRESYSDCLRRVFERMRQYNMRLNPAKSVFGLSSGKLLAFLVSRRGLEIDPSKIARKKEH